MGVGFGVHKFASGDGVREAARVRGLSEGVSLVITPGARTRPAGAVRKLDKVRRGAVMPAARWGA